jgi:C-terminal processing protease CtpA/Prc
MKTTFLTWILILFSCVSFCQVEKKPDLNFGFERVTKHGQLPDNWFRWGTPDYKITPDTTEKHSGTNSLLIELPGDKTDRSFGCCATSIPVNFQGKQIELRAYMKLQNVSKGPIGLMLRIDGENGSLGFDNMQQKNIQGTSDWKLYSVSLALPENAKVIYIGALLSGTGKLWVDEFQLLIDGEDIGKVKPISKKLFKADSDVEFDKGSNITSLNLSTSKTEDLILLGKVWGFLKYYHPAIASGNYNWDYELFRILPKIITSKNYQERNEILSDWIFKLGEVEIGKPEKIDETQIKLKPDLSWITNISKLEDKLSKQLIEIRDAKRSNDHFYIGLAQNVGNPQFKNEKSYNNIPLKSDIGYRLLSLYRYWNIIQYYFPYKNLIDKDWSEVLAEYVPKFVNASSDLEYKLVVLSLIASIHDTHANIWGTDPVLQAYRGLNYAPLEVKFIENKAVVTGYLNESDGEKSGLQKGDIILTVNNKKIDKIIEEKLPFTPASNYPRQLRDMAMNLLRTNDSIIEIKFQRGTTELNLKIKCLSLKTLVPFEGSTKRDTCFKLLSPEIGYIYPGTIKNEYLPKIMEEVKNTRGLIIDMRTYPSEFIVFTLGGYLMPAATNFVKFSKTSNTSPGLFTYYTTLSVGKNNNDYYKGKVVIIVNETTLSQAEYTTMAFRVTPTARVIGSTTAGADGNVSGFDLPGGIRTMISGIGVYYPDGKETQRVGIVPDIIVKPTIKGIIEGRDELLERAIEIINEK